MSRCRFLFLFLTFGFFASCASTPKQLTISPAETSLTELMASRLEISREVAWIKFLNHLPVRDPQREAELVNRMVTEGQAYGLKPQTVEAFFTAQIQASCLVQKESIRYWKRGGTLPAYAPRDLKKDIRPELDKIGANILRELARVEGQKTTAGLESATYRMLRQRGFSWHVARTAAAPLE